jgi:polyisoprenoid-binding protein YceI
MKFAIDNQHKNMKFLKLTAVLLFITNLLFGQSYTVSDEGSKVRFVIKNFGVKTGGNFAGLKGTVVFNPKALATSQMEVSINANTVDTDNDARDKHLKKDEYFGVEKFPLITFTSTKITESTVAGRYFVVGNLTIKGVTKSIQFGFSATPSATGNVFNGEFEINRRDFGVGGNSVSMSDKLKVILSISAKK